MIKGRLNQTQIRTEGRDGVYFDFNRDEVPFLFKVMAGNTLNPLYDGWAVEVTQGNTNIAKPGFLLDVRNFT